MRPLRRLGSACVVVVAAVVAYACSDGPTVPDRSSRQGPGTFSPSVEGLPSATFAPCGQPRVVRLLAHDGRVLGALTVSNDGNEVVVVYESLGDWELEETHLAVAASLDDVPTTRAGLPQLGRFPLGSDHLPGITRVAFSASLADLAAVPGDALVLVGQASLVDRNDPSTLEDDERVGVWAEGTPLSRRPQGNTGTYFHHGVQACAVAQTVGAEGGTLVLSGGAPFVRAELVIPPGALEEPVEITIEPVPLSDVPLPPSGFPELDDLVAGTAYDFGPDGLAFLVPARLMIEYDEAALGGRPESDLTLLRIDGGVERIAGSIVDETANEISASIDHFTIYVSAIQGGSATRLDESVGVSDEVTVRVLLDPAVAADESIGVVDEVTINVLSTRGSDVAETIGVVDAVSIDVLSPPRSSVEEAVGVVDQVGIEVLRPARPSVDESVGVVDAVSINVMGSVRSDVGEAIGVTDAVSIDVVPPEPDPMEVYVALEDADSVAVVDAISNTVVRTIAVGSRPYSVAANPTRSEVYVTNRGDATVSIISTVTRTVVGTIPVIDFIDPIDIRVSRDGSKAYVVDQAWSWVAVIDLASRTRDANLEGGPLNVRSMTLNPQRDVAYVSGDDFVVVFDLAAGVPVDTITGILATRHMTVTPDGGELWLTEVGDAVVEVVDLSTGQLVSTVEGIARPRGIAMGPSAAWVASVPIVSVDISTRSVGTPVEVPVDFTPEWIVVTADGRTAFVSEGRFGTDVSVIDLSTGTVVAILPVGSTPAGLAVFENN